MQAGILSSYKNIRPLSEIKIQLPFAANLVQALNIETTSYLQQFDAFCNHSAKYCMTCLISDPMGEIQGGPIIVPPAVCVLFQRTLFAFHMI